MKTADYKIAFEYTAKGQRVAAVSDVVVWLYRHGEKKLAERLVEKSERAFDALDAALSHEGPSTWRYSLTTREPDGDLTDPDSVSG
jgi:hypothetical protein